SQAGRLLAQRLVGDRRGQRSKGDAIHDRCEGVGGGGNAGLVEDRVLVLLEQRVLFLGQQRCQASERALLGQAKALEHMEKAARVGGLEAVLPAERLLGGVFDGGADDLAQLDVRIG